MDPFFIWLESTNVSIWLRESPAIYALPAILTAHTIGMGIVAGINAVVALRVLGVAPGVPLRELRRFLPFMWFGFWLNLATGIGLILAYPTKALTNPVFYLKLALVAVAVGLVAPVGQRLSLVEPDDIAPGEPFATSIKFLAGASLTAWGGAIVAGRLLAYTYTRLTAIP
jgi:energy-coupling factor transporter transmembrane protein EcfT